MDLKAYKQRYFDFDSAVMQTRLIALLASHFLEEFPTRFALADGTPHQISNLIVAFIDKLWRQPRIRELLNKLEEGGVRDFDNQIAELGDAEAVELLAADIGQPAEWAELVARAAIPMLSSHGAAISLGGGEPQRKFPFQPLPLAHAQELVMLFAHLDGFLSDSVRAMCLARPEILTKRRHQLSWEDVLKARTWEGVLELMVERYTYKIGWESIVKRVEILRSHHDLDIEMNNTELVQIDLAEQLRNVVVHNGGRASQEYLRRSGRQDVVIGDLVPIERDYTNGIANLCRVLGANLFIAIAKNFFDALPSALLGAKTRATVLRTKKDGIVSDLRPAKPA